MYECYLREKLNESMCISCDVHLSQTDRTSNVAVSSFLTSNKRLAPVTPVCNLLVQASGYCLPFVKKFLDNEIELRMKLTPVGAYEYPCTSKPKSS